MCRLIWAFSLHTPKDVFLPRKTSKGDLFVLRFCGPVNLMGSCRAWSVYLTTHLLGRLSPLWLTSIVHILSPETDNCPSWMSGRESLFVLRFYGSVNPMGSCRVQSVYLTILLLGGLSPLWLIRILPETDNCPSWISGRERMTIENISWSISRKECCWPRLGLNPRPPGLQSDGTSNWANEVNRRERMTVENISWSTSTKECCRPRRGLNPQPPGHQSDGTSNWANKANGRERMTVENISWSISMKECCRPRRGLNPPPPGLQSDGASTEPPRLASNGEWIHTALDKRGVSSNFFFYFSMETYVEGPH